MHVHLVDLHLVEVPRRSAGTSAHVVERRGGEPRAYWMTRHLQCELQIKTNACKRSSFRAQSVCSGKAFSCSVVICVIA